MNCPELNLNSQKQIVSETLDFSKHSFDLVKFPQKRDL